jgi:hypothetical protein
VKSDLYLNDGELVIPYGGTLVFSGASIKGLTDNSKLIGAGDLDYREGTVDFTTRPGAKLIVTEEFRGAYVRLPDDPADGRPILANSSQIVYIQPRFDDFTTYVSTQVPPSPIFGSYGGILALKAPENGNITEAQATALKENTKGLKVYIVGKVKFLSDITLKNEGPGTVPPPQASSESRGILANYNNDLDEDDLNTLVVAGDVDVNGYKVDANGFTVWGALLDTTPPTGKVLTTANTPLVAYTARLTRPVFEGPVHLYAPIVNGFDNTVWFKNDVVIDGPAAFTEARFEGNATFNGYVSFANPGANGIVFAGSDVELQKKITFNAGAEFVSGFTLDGSTGYEAGSVSFTVRGKAPVKFSYKPSLENFNSIVGVVDPDEENAGRIELSPPEGAELNEYLTYNNVTIRTPVKIGTQATFNGKTVFEKDVTFGTQSIDFNTGANSELIVKGTAKVEEGINFGTASYNINNLVFGTISAGNYQVYLGTAGAAYGGLGSAAVRTIGEATFTEGNYYGIGKNVTINGIVFASTVDTGTASLSVPAGKSKVVIGGKKITVDGTISSLKQAVVTLKEGQSISAAGSKSELVFYSAEAGTEPAGIQIRGYLDKTGNFTVNSGSVKLNSVKLEGLNNVVASVKVEKETELIVPLQATLSVGTASLIVNNTLNSRIVLGGTAAGPGSGSFSAIVLTSNGTLSVNSFNKNTSAIGGWIVAGTTGAGGNGVALIGSTATGGFGTVSGNTYNKATAAGTANVITQGVQFVGTTATAEAGSVAASGEAPRNKIFSFAEYSDE